MTIRWFHVMLAVAAAGVALSLRQQRRQDAAAAGLVRDGPLARQPVVQSMHEERWDDDGDVLPRLHRSKGPDPLLH